MSLGGRRGWGLGVFHRLGKGSHQTSEHGKTLLELHRLRRQSLCDANDLVDAGGSWLGRLRVGCRRSWSERSRFTVLCWRAIIMTSRLNLVVLHRRRGRAWAYGVAVLRLGEVWRRRSLMRLHLLGLQMNTRRTHSRGNMLRRAGGVGRQRSLIRQVVLER